VKGWWRSPSGQLNDPRCAKLSLAARGLLWSLSDVADGRGAVPLGAMTLDEVLLAVSGRDPEEPVRAAWLELHRVRLAYVEGGVIALDLPAVDAGDDGARPLPNTAEESPRPARAAALRAWFSKLRLKTCDARVRWLDSEHGQRAIDRLGLTRDEALVMAEGAGQHKGRFGHERPAATRGATVAHSQSNREQPVASAPGATTGATEVSPTPPSGEIETKKEAEPNASNREQPVASAPGATTGATEVSPTPRLSSWERTGARVSATEVLFTLRTDGGLRLSAGPVQENELDGVLQGVTPVWTLDGTRHLARHIKAGHLRDGWRPSIAHLRGRDGSWTTLLSLYDEAQTCERCAQTRPATVAHKPAVKTVEKSAKPRLPPEEIRARALKVIEEIQQRKGKK